MISWTKKIASILGFTVFFAVILVNLSVSDSFEVFSFISLLLKALLAASLFWFVGLIVGDIFFKGVITDIEHDEMNVIEGGILQRIDMKQQQAVPGSPDMPFADADTKMKNQKRGKK